MLQMLELVFQGLKPLNSFDAGVCVCVVTSSWMLWMHKVLFSSWMLLKFSDDGVCFFSVTAFGVCIYKWLMILFLLPTNSNAAAAIFMALLNDASLCCLQRRWWKLH